MAKQEKGSPQPLTRKQYDKQLRKLQAELCKLQEWVRHEGRDAAGKGGTRRQQVDRRVRPRA